MECHLFFFHEKPTFVSDPGFTSGVVVPRFDAGAVGGTGADHSVVGGTGGTGAESFLEAFSEEEFQTIGIAAGEPEPYGPKKADFAEESTSTSVKARRGEEEQVLGARKEGRMWIVEAEKMRSKDPRSNIANPANWDVVEQPVPSTVPIDLAAAVPEQSQASSMSGGGFWGSLMMLWLIIS